MEIRLAVGIGVVAAWMVGFVRAVRREPINQRLNTRHSRAAARNSGDMRGSTVNS